MSEKYVRQSSGARAVALDNRVQLAKIRLLLLLALLSCATLALVTSGVTMLLGH